MIKIKNYGSRFTIVALCIVMLFASFGTNVVNVQASTSITEGRKIAGTGAKVSQGNHTAWWADGISYLYAGGEVAFCVEPTIIGVTGHIYTAGDFDVNTQRTLSRITYYGWDTTAKTDTDYAVTQYMIWEALGSSIEWMGSFGANYPSLKTGVQSKIDRHGITPSFNGGNYSVNLGDTLSIADNNGVLNQYHVKSNAGASVSFSGNNLVFIPNINTPENITIVLQKELANCVGSSIAYRSGTGQDVGLFKVSDPQMIRINIKVNKYVDVTLDKQDKDITMGSQGDASLIGAEYSLFESNDTLVETKTIDDTLKIKFEKLMANKEYYIQETKAPNGYLINNEKISIKPAELLNNGSVGTDLQYKVTSKDEVITGDFDLEKVITDGSNSEIVEKEEGAEFIVVAKKYVEKYGTIEEAYKHISEYTNKEHDLLVTNADGYDKSTPLAFGTYIVKQTKGQIDTDKYEATWEFKVEKENQKTIRYIINNRPFTSYLKIVKKDVDTGKTIVLDNTTFKIFDVDNHKYVTQKVGGETQSEFSTDGKGYVVLPLQLKAGHYRLDEIKAPSGYLLNTTSVTFKITNGVVGEVDADGDPIQIVEFTDKAVKGQVSLKKNGNVFIGTEVNEDGTLKLIYENKGLAGMEADLFAEENIIDSADGSILYNKDELVTSLITNGEGEWNSDEIPLGTYRFVETKAPIGFVKLEKPIILTFEYKDDMTPIVSEELDIRNSRPKYEIDFTKRLELNDIENKDAYKDVVFGVYTRDDTYDYKGNVAIEPDTLVALSGIDENGRLTTKAELPVGNYYLKEVETNEAYVLDEGEYDFYIAQSSQENVLVEVNAGEEVLNELKDFKLKVEKIDSITLESIANREFEFTRYADKECIKVIDKANANTMDGTALFDDIHYGITYIKESKAPNGYLLSDEVVKVEVNKDGVFVNDKKYEIGNGDVYSIKFPNSLIPSVKTGDKTTRNILLWSALASLGVIVVIGSKKRKEGK